MKEIDIGFIVKNISEINTRFNFIKDSFPEENENILKHLASAAIHITFFMKDFYEITKDEKVSIDKELEEKFLNNCGCKELL